VSGRVARRFVADDWQIDRAEAHFVANT